MITLPASSRSCCGSHPRVAAHQRLSGRSHSARNDRSTITSPTAETTRSRTQIRPGIHGAIQVATPHSRSPPGLDKGSRSDKRQKERCRTGARRDIGKRSVVGDGGEDSWLVAANLAGMERVEAEAIYDSGREACVEF